MISIYLHSNFSGGHRKTTSFLQEWRFGRSRSSKVIDVGTNRKRVYDFLLVRHSNLGPILHCFEDFACFMCSWPHPYSTLILGCTSGYTRSNVLGSARAQALSYLAVKLFSKYSKLTDRPTDGRTTYNLITALCIASRGKKLSWITVVHLGLYFSVLGLVGLELQSRPKCRIIAIRSYWSLPNYKLKPRCWQHLRCYLHILNLYSYLSETLSHIITCLVHVTAVKQ